MTKNAQERSSKQPDNLVTERDIDPDFGLFTEDSFPDALEDKDQREANMPSPRKSVPLPLNPLRINHNVMKLNRTDSTV